ncbi:alpha/beta hydrolase [Hymenobacter sp. RP-2-7]|uniref:Alpha/beta hydrolase n=1 Tax=Hymenobacter polaris TaxID=2682546 RepID=A0A7Y0AA79_9BACT|nr:alpha/beta hydrolase [Hymenobacter polaris]NML63618.1 alpha/beta hydrolase [Hymenobacter polaris]
MLTTTLTQHALSAPDRAAMATLRAAAAPFKGKLAGPDARPMFAALMGATPAAPGISCEAATVGGVPGYWCRPAHAPADAALLYLHGGAYVLGSAEAYRNLAGQLAARVGVECFVADYRLAPEHPFPAAPNDVLAVYRDLVALGRTRLVLAGDSAGGGLALATLATVAATPGLPAPRAAAVLSPWTDLALTGDTFDTRAAADLSFTKEMPLGASARLYLAGHDAHDPQASPFYGELAGLPPVQIQVGDDEVLLDDAVRYAGRVQAAGGQAELHVWLGMGHVFPASVGTLEAAREAFDSTGSFLRCYLA